MNKMNQTQTRSPRKRWLSLLLAVVLVVGLLPISAFASNDAYSLSASSRFFIVSESDPTETDLGNFVQLIDQEFAAKNKPNSAPLAIVYGQEKDAENGDIVVKVDSSLAAQSYKISVGQKVTVAGGDAAGVFYGLTNLLQMVEKGSLQDVSNSPLVEERSAYIDCGRVYYSPALLKALIKTLAWNRMNTLYLDFSNNNATRFFLDEMKVTAGGKDYDITNVKPSDGKYLTQADMADIIKVAKQYGVQIIPTFNSPGHIGGLYSLNNSLFVYGLTDDYDRNCGKITLNIADQNAYDFGQAVVKLYVDFFAQQGCKSFNIAADEATLSGVNYNSTNETFVKYVNDLNTYIKSKGMTTRMFNDGVKSVNSGIDKDIVILYWTTEGDSSAINLIGAGYKVVNFNCHAGLYYAYMGSVDGAYVWNQNVEKLYDNWNPGVLSCKVYSWDSHEYEYTPVETMEYSEYAGKLIGANFAVWSDYAFFNNKDGTAIINADDKNVVEKIQVVGDRCWSNKSSKTYANWKADLTTAPGGIDVRNNYAIDSTVLPAASAITSAIEASIVVDTASAQGVKVSATKDGKYQVILPEITEGATLTVQLSMKNLAEGQTAVWSSSKEEIATVGENTGLVTFTGEPGTVTITAQPLSNTNADEATDTYEVTFEVKAAGELTVKEITVQEGRTYDVTLNGDWVADVKNLSNDYVQVDAAYNRTAEYELQAVTGIDEIVSGEQYLIVNQRMVQKNDDNQLLTNGAAYWEGYSGLSLSGKPSTDSKALWTITTSGSGYTVQYNSTATNNYLNIGDNTASVSGTEAKLTLSYKNNDAADGYPSKYWSISFGNYYLNNLGNDKCAGGWKYVSGGNKANTDVGSRWTLYRIVEKTAANTTTVTFTGLKVGTTSVTIGDTTYRITVTEKKLVEIPITIIDYRADGLLFDYDYNKESYAYGLVHVSSGNGEKTGLTGKWGETLPGDEYGTKIAGTTLERTNTRDSQYANWSDSNRWDNTWSRAGLVKPELGSNGMPQYTEATIKYVASLLAAGNFNDVSSSSFSCNTVLQNTFLKSTSPRSVLSTDTTSMTGFSDAFKDTRSYANITNAYDLAWYLLNTIYQADTNMTTVTGTDNAEHQVPIYGMAVDAYKSIVLTDNGSGTYSFEAGYSGTKKDVRYDWESGTIYNGTNEGDESGFYPLENLGYEQSGLLKNTSIIDGKHRNGSFTLRGESQFVYNKDDNLYFTFTGDDDVYMYINGVLALDLGGAHGRNYKTVNLNDLNKTEYGLVDGEVATFTFFYMERNSDASTFGIETNMELVKPDIDVQKNAYSDSQYTNEVNSGEAVSNGSIVYYDLVVSNQGNTAMTNISIIDTDSFGGSAYLGAGKTAAVTAGSKTEVGLVSLGEQGYTYFIVDKDGNKGTSTTCGTLEELSKAVAGLTLEGGAQLHIRFLKAAVDVKESKIISYTNTLNVTAMSGGQKLSDSAIHTIYSYNAGGTDKTYVVDFGLPLKITGIFDGTAKEYIGNGEIKLTKKPKYGEVTNFYADGMNTSMVYKLNARTTIDGQDTITLNVPYKFGSTPANLDKNIYIIPASNVYYEDNLASFQPGKGVAKDATWSIVGNDDEAATEKTDVYQALEELGGVVRSVYGYDEQYNNSSKLSMSTAHKVTVKSEMLANWKKDDATSAWPTASFTFTGTGFDVISLTDNTSGAILVKVTGAGADNKGFSKNYLVNNYYGYDYDEKTGEWKVVNDGSKNALYQIPVMKVDVPYGAYNVTIQVFYNQVFDKTGHYQYNFWLDAIRVYNPMGEYADYTKDNEGYPQYIKLHDALVNGTAKPDGETDKMVFIDGGSTADIATYANYGPNNEVYLAKGQAISFKVSANDKIASIQIGAKAPDGKATMVVEGKVSTATKLEQQLNTATEMYYNITEQAKNGQLVTISNTGDGILSLTNLKITYKTSGQAVTLESLTAEEQANAVAMVQALFASPVETFQPERFEASWGGSVRAGRKATLTVKASEDVDAITVNGVTVSSYTTRTERTGWGWWSPKVTYRVFTYTITATATADYQVCAVNSAGISSEPVIATLTVRPATWWNWWF